MADLALARQTIATVQKAFDDPNLRRGMVQLVRTESKVDRMIALALNTLKYSPSILDAEPRSIIGSILEATQLSLELDRNLGQAFILAFKNRKTNRKIATLCVGYKGFIHLGHNSSLIHTINGEIVRAEDEFDVGLGSKRFLHHKPKLTAKGRNDEKNWIGGYSTVLYANGSTDFEFMTMEEILAIRKRSPSARQNDGPWITDTDKMWRKTPIRLLAKRIPQSPENLNLVHTATVDELRDFGIRHGRHINAQIPTPPAFEEFLPQEDEPIDVGTAAADPAPAEVQRKSEQAAASGSAALIDQPRIGAIKQKMEEKCMSPEEVEAFLKNHGVFSSSDLTMAKFGDFWSSLLSWKRGNNAGKK